MDLSPPVHASPLQMEWLDELLNSVMHSILIPLPSHLCRAPPFQASKRAQARGARIVHTCSSMGQAPPGPGPGSGALTLTLTPTPINEQDEVTHTGVWWRCEVLSPLIPVLAYSSPYPAHIPRYIHTYTHSTWVHTNAHTFPFWGPFLSLPN